VRALRRTATLVALVALPLLAAAQSGAGPYALRKHAVTGGGRATGGPYALVATTGQPVAGTSQAGGQRLASGFHGPATLAAGDALFRNGFE
jgi:hypothetical protein